LRRVCAGSYSCLAAVFRLQRKIGQFVMQSYIPSVLIVVLSWVGFWINKNCDPARVSLGVTTVLTMTTVSAASKDVRVSYLKALDVWYAACMVFVFSALLEYAFINVSVRTENRRRSTIRETAASTDRVLGLLRLYWIIIWENHSG